MAYWKSAALGEYSLGEVTVDPAGADMVVSYILVFSSKPAGDSNRNGNPNSVEHSIGLNQSLRVVSVWQQAKRGWMLTATSLTPIRE